MKVIYLSVLLIVIFFHTYQLHTADFYCEGFLCNTPLTNSALIPISAKLESDYLKQISLSFNESIFAMSMLKGYSATGVPTNMDIGAGEGFNHRQKESLLIQTEKYTMTGLINSAYSMAPGFYVGFNLGSAADLFVEKHSKVWDKLGLYLNYMDASQEISTYHRFIKNSTLNGKIKSRNQGVSLRYALIEDIMLFPALLDFSGVTFETGYSELSNKVEVRDFLSDFFTLNIGIPAEVLYKRSTLNIHTKSRNKYGEFRTGFRLFHFITFFGGVGLRSSSLDNVVNANWISFLRFDLKQSIIKFPDISSETNIAMILRNYYSMKIEGDYKKLGMQIEVWNFKMVIEGFTTRGTQTLGAYIVYSF
jgi:hypothetical protein